MLTIKWPNISIFFYVLLFVNTFLAVLMQYFTQSYAFRLKVGHANHVYSFDDDLHAWNNSVHAPQSTLHDILFLSGFCTNFSSAKTSDFIHIKIYFQCRQTSRIKCGFKLEICFKDLHKVYSVHLKGAKLSIP